jgi:hypothetical protein
VTAIDVAWALAWLFAAIKFFQRRRYVPLLIIGASLLRGVQVIGFGRDSFPPRSVAITFAAIAALVAYFSLSTRVRRTFTQ